MPLIHHGVGTREMNDVIDLASARQRLEARRIVFIGGDGIKVEFANFDEVHAFNQFLARCQEKGERLKSREGAS
jgi:hypothetical protein